MKRKEFIAGTQQETESADSLQIHNTLENKKNVQKATKIRKLKVQSPVQDEWTVLCKKTSDQFPRLPQNIAWQQVFAQAIGKVFPKPCIVYVSNVIVNSTTEEVSFHVRCATPSSMRLSFERDAFTVGMPNDAFNKTFKDHGVEWTVQSIHRRCSKYPIGCVDPLGNVRQFTAGYVQEKLAKSRVPSQSQVSQ